MTDEGACQTSLRSLEVPALNHEQVKEGIPSMFSS